MESGNSVCSARTIKAFAAYGLLSILAFVIAHLGGDAWAQHRVLGTTWRDSVAEAMKNVAHPGTTLFMFTPFLGLAIWSGLFHGAERMRSGAAVFALGAAVLCYFYFDAHYWAEVSAQQKRWTAAALGIGALPFFVGIPVVLASLGLHALAIHFDGRQSE